MKVARTTARLLVRARKPVLAFGGGGARGFVHIGAMRVLDRIGVKPRAVAGTSMGSLVGAMYLVHGDAAGVEAAWRRVIDAEMLPVVRQVRRLPRAEKKEHPLIQVAKSVRNRIVVSFALNRSTVLDGAVLDEIIDALLPDIDIEELPAPYIAVATDLETGAEVRLDRGSLRTAVKASSSIPGMVPAVEVDGRELVDGGVVAEVPVAAARGLGWPVLAVDASMDLPPIDDDENALDTMMRTQMMTARLLRRRQLGDATWVIRPDIGSIAWADWEVFDDMIVAGENAARAFFGIAG